MTNHINRRAPLHASTDKRIALVGARKRHERVGLGVVLLALAVFTYPARKTLVKFEAGGITIDLFMILLFLAALVAVIGLVLGRYRFTPNWTDFWVFVLGLSFLKSTWAAEDLMESGYLVLHSLYLPILLYALIRVLVVSGRGLAWLLGAGLGMGLITAGTAIWVAVTTGTRPFVFDVAPIGAASLIASVLIVGIALRWYSTLVKGLTLAFLASGLLATFSRIFILMVVFVPAMLKFVRSGRLRALFIFVWAASLLVTLVITTQGPSLEPAEVEKEEIRSMARIFNWDTYEHALYGRAFSYREGLETFRQYPFFGTGMTRDDTGATRHNFHIQWLEYGGLVGYFAYLMVFLSFLGRYSSRSISRFEAGAGVAMLIILANGVTNGFMHGVMPNAAFFLMGAIVVYGRVQQQVQNSTLTPTDTQEAVGEDKVAQEVLRERLRPSNL